MCSIFGILASPRDKHEASNLRYSAVALLNHSKSRGRDGYGYLYQQAGSHNFIEKQVGSAFRVGMPVAIPEFRVGVTTKIVGNCRAEPTTEYVKEKRREDQQPYSLNGWHIAHNGTVANDKELRTELVDTKIDSAAIVEIMPRISKDMPPFRAFEYFTKAIKQLKGSFAILAANDEIKGHVFVAANYRPVWYAVGDGGVCFASSKETLERSCCAGVPQMLPPYTAAMFNIQGIARAQSLYEDGADNRVLVVCSGGLDSVTAASVVQQGFTVELAHFVYGCRAEEHELKAVRAVAEYMGVKLHVIPMPIYDPKDSPLLRKDQDIAGGEAGAEFAHEWVPARNLVMLAYATAFAEANGFRAIALGNNLEEAGAYPDNEPEFINRFRDLLPFAVRDGYKLEILQPVGHMMKHEIVALGHKIGAPLHLTWSCYKHGEKHCGTCGPCFMRKTAFEINGLKEVIEYENSNMV